MYRSQVLFFFQFQMFKILSNSSIEIKSQTIKIRHTFYCSHYRQHWLLFRLKNNKGRNWTLLQWFDLALVLFFVGWLTMIEIASFKLDIKTKYSKKIKITIFFSIYLLVMPKYWGKQIRLGSFPEVERENESR